MEKVLKIIKIIRKVVFVALLAFYAGFSSAQNPVEIECDFFSTIYDDYVCLIYQQNATDRNASYVFVGDHEEGKTNADVVAVGVFFSNMTFIIPEIYTSFPNITELDIEFTGLTEIDPIPATVNLEFFICYRNDLSTIANETFATQNSSLIYLEMMDNGITTLEEDAFVGGSQVVVLYLLFNRINTPPTRTFWPLTTVGLIDIEANNFQRIHHTLFLQNNELEIVFMENNNISAVSPQFTFGFRDTMFAIVMYRNECIDRAFILEEDIVIAFMHSSLQGCYNNFTNADPNANRTITLEFRGPLRLFDDFGNLILVSN